MVNDSNFCANGLVAADRSLHPHIWEVKKVLQYVHFEPVVFTPGRIRIVNRHDFIGLERYMLHWAVECEGRAVQEGKTEFPPIAPQSSGEMELPLQPHPADGKEYFLTLRVFTKEDAPMIPKGHEVAIEQWALPVSPVERKVRPVEGALSVIRSDETVALQGDRFLLSFSTRTGEMTELNYHGKNLIREVATQLLETADR
ncbi:beta-galactosidase [Bacteroides pyogenes JCM 10003]|nr:beta-galactosidase [Bacteroides pyogenes JCM 10003]